MDDIKQQLVDKLKAANNILVTVSRDPSVDQLASCLALALLLNKLGKHTAGVFSGQIPSTIEFLEPEETLEKNTDSLRDFIIALDKSKADKLRYKVEDNIVRIFITPYRTSINTDDLDFSQGDFNVDVVVALGVSRQEDLDEAITAHGRILHDATVASINLNANQGLGSINWQNPKASSLCELVTDLAFILGPGLMDSQIANALLTGIVSSTDRFRNNNTTPETMSASSKLMSAGANQQLVASKLEQNPTFPASNVNDAPLAEPASDAPATQSEDGSLHIEHTDDKEPAQTQSAIDLPELGESSEGAADTNSPDTLDEIPRFLEPPRAAPPPGNGPPIEDTVEEANEDTPKDNFDQTPKLMTGPPMLGGELTANSQTEGLDPVTDPMSMPQAEAPQIFERKQPQALSKPAPRTVLTPPPTNWAPPTNPAPSLVLPPTPPISPPPLPAASDSTQPPVPPAANIVPGTTLSDIEAATKAAEQREGGMDTARDEVSRALSASTDVMPEPIQALNAQPLGDSLHPTLNELLSGETVADSQPPAGSVVHDASPGDSNKAASPPPVPPPLPIQLNNPNSPQQ